MKKSLKIWLIVWWSLLIAWWAWAWLTKAWVIPNWFDIELLCPNTKIIRRSPFIIEDNYDGYKYIKIDDSGWYNQYRNEWTYKDYKDYKENTDLAEAMKAMKLRATSCPNIFCQQVADDWTYNNQKHYYRDSRNKEMILIPNVYYVSDCTYYDRLFSKDELISIWLEDSESIKDNNTDLLYQILQNDWWWGNPQVENIELIAAKPIIYLYPIQETQVNVTLWTPEKLLYTYPKYNWEKWRNVIAQPNWDLKDIDTWKKLYALYWEWKSNIETNFDEGFIVAWKDIIPFLEEKLAILWLNEREAEEFIVYWLPQMEDNKYNLIRFETIEEQDENMPLNITPTPDTVIRVMMDWKAIDEPIDIPEQELTTPERNGFTVVERWGSPRN